MVTYFCNMVNKLHWCSQQELIPTPGNLYIFCIECTLKLIANELELRVLSGSLQTSSSIFKDVTLKKFCFLHIANMHSSAIFLMNKIALSHLFLQQIYGVCIIDILSRMDRKTIVKM